MRAPQHARMAPAAATAYGKLPLSFEPNAGRMDPSVRFIARGHGYLLSLNRRDAVLSLDGNSIRTQLVGAARSPRVVGGAVQPGRLNSYVGRDRSRWVHGAHLYGNVSYRGVYPGVDLVYHGRQGALEYDFVVAPGANADRIAVRFRGAAPRLDAGGNLRLGKAMQKRPVAYQVVDGKRVRVPAAFDLSNGRVSFRLGSYDHRRPLVIDPVLAYSTYLGGPNDDSARGIAVDANKSAYITGTVNETLVGDPAHRVYGPNVAGDQDAFVAKLSPDGQSIAYVTYYGGGDGNGPQADTPYGIALDSANNAYVAGTTQSIDFPTTQGAYQGWSNSLSGSNGYVLKLDADGSLSWASYLGGAGNDGATAIAVNSHGVYLTGYTDDGTFPHTTAVAFKSNDAFVTRFKLDGTGLDWSTFIGGTNLDIGKGIAVDGNLNVVAVGDTSSSDFPLQAAPLSTVPDSTYANGEMFMSSFADSDGSLLTSTFLGGSQVDSASGVATDSGSDYVIGTTGSSTDFPGNPTNYGGGSSDAIVVALSAGGSITGARYIGTFGADEGHAIARDPSGYGSGLYVTGITGASGLSEVNPLQPASARSGRAFIAKLESYNLSNTLYLSYLGGASQDSFPNSGTAVATDPSDGGQNHFAAYFLGNTKSASFPTKNAVQPTNAGGQDMYLAKVELPTPSIDSGPSGPVKSTTVSFGFSWTDTLDDTQFYCWLNNVGYPQPCTSPVTFTNVPQGPHTFNVSALDGGNTASTVASRDFVVDTVAPSAPELVSPDDGAKTDTQPTFSWHTATDATTSVEKYQLLVDGAGDREVSASDCTGGTCSAQVTKALSTGTHTWTVTATDSAGNLTTATARAFVAQQAPTAHFTIAPNPALVGHTVTFDGSGSNDAAHTIVHYEWDLNGDGSFETDLGATATTSHVYTSPGNVPISLRVTDSTGLSATTSINLLVTAQGGSGQFGVSINNGAQYTNDPNVVVTSVFPAGTTALLFSNDGGFFAPSQFAAARETKWRLDSSGPERLPKIVYARFLAGPIVSETHTDDIILDETPPKVQAASVTPAAAAASARVASAAKLAKYVVKVKATDSNSGVGKLQVTANKRKPGKLVAYKRKLMLKSAKRPRFIRARDRAGNFSAWRKLK